MSDPSPSKAPSLADIEAIARRAYDALPEEFRAICKDLVIQVVDWPDDETLNAMNAETEYDLLGLFGGVGLAHAEALPQTYTLPNVVWLYRRPLLDFWCDGENTLEEVVTHVLIHEIGHHFGLSDDDMERIESSVS